MTILKNETPRKRESGYARMKKRALKAEAQKRESQSKEVAALEALVRRLLNHLDTATSGELTAGQRRGYQNIVADVRKNLTE